MSNSNTLAVIRILDDDPGQLDSLSFMLETEGWKVKTYRSAFEFLSGDSPSEPGCLILDLRMPGMTGLQLQDEMKKRRISLPIIFLSGHGDIDLAVETMRAGALTFLQKTVSDEQLLATIAEAVEKDRLKREPPFDQSLGQRQLAQLTERERQILDLVVQGKLNRDIGGVLGISERTVETHRHTLYRKLMVKSTAELMNFCQRMKML